MMRSAYTRRAKEAVHSVAHSAAHAGAHAVYEHTLFFSLVIRIQRAAFSFGIFMTPKQITICSRRPAWTP
jgi:hypothetical protein